MLVSSFNLNTLMIFTENSSNKSPKIEKNNDVTRVSSEEDGKTLGFNFANYPLAENGPVKLSTAEISDLNSKIKQAGFEDVLIPNADPDYVVAGVISVQPHPDSDHLFIVDVNIGSKEVQIVTANSNIEANQKIVVALPGAILPSGLIIWEGELRGEKSYGMIPSAMTLKLKNAPQISQALVLPDDFAEIGDEFDFEKGNSIY
jgi:tRNA-binding protein